MKNEEEEDHGRRESVGDGDHGRESRSGNTRISRSLRRSSSSCSASRSRTNLITRSGRRTEPVQRRASHSGNTNTCIGFCIAHTPEIQINALYN